MIDVRETTVEKYAVMLRSQLERSTARSIRRADTVRDLDLTFGRTVRLPRRDDEIIRAWLMRSVRRVGLYPVSDPKWDYEMDPIGPTARQYASVRVLVAKDDHDREVFASIRRVEGHALRYFGPRDDLMVATMVAIPPSEASSTHE